MIFDKINRYNGENMKNIDYCLTFFGEDSKKNEETDDGRNDLKVSDDL